ncbi:MAG: PepSY-like domain-containing protein [Bacteroidaceae bacterium]|nr:PepSY-like domain-containing protein [Bacteroidaceae bacterium]
MKKFFVYSSYYLSVALVSLVLMSSCEKDDDIRWSDVPQAVVSAFEAKFPDAGRTEWEKKRGYYVVELWYQQVETQAWFEKDGTWRMTETDLGRTVANLPEAVQQALADSKYASWGVDDLDKYERPTDTFYLVEVETNGQRDRDLFFSPDGTLLSDEMDRDGNEVTPDKEF